MIERLAKNDPSLTEVDLSGNTIFTMKPMEVGYAGESQTGMALDGSVEATCG